MAVCCGLAFCACLAIASVSSADVAAAIFCRFGVSGACDQSIDVAEQTESCESDALYDLCSRTGLLTPIVECLGHCYCSAGLPRHCRDVCYDLTSGRDTFCSSACPDYVARGHVALANGSVNRKESGGDVDGGGNSSASVTLLYSVVAIAAVVTMLLLTVVAILVITTSRFRCVDEACRMPPYVRSEKAYPASDVRGTFRKLSSNSLDGYFAAQNIHDSADVARKKAVTAAVTVATSPSLLTQLTTDK